MLAIKNMDNPENSVPGQKPENESMVLCCPPIQELSELSRIDKPLFSREVTHVPEQYSAQQNEKIIEQLIRCEKDLDKGIIPLEFPNPALYSSKEWIAEFRAKYETLFIDDKHRMFALVDQTWTARLARKIGDAKCLEVCAGKGWLAKALATNGVKVIATDIDPHEDSVFAIEQISANDAIDKYNFDYLIISWPHMKVLESCFKKLKPMQKIIYIGPEKNEERGWVSTYAFDNTEILDKWEIPHMPSVPSHIFFLETAMSGK